MYVNLPNYGTTGRRRGIGGDGGDRDRDRSGADKLTSLTDGGSDCTLYGPASRVLEGLEEWYANGLKTPILVPSSASGGQFRAFDELFSLFDGA